MKVLISVDWEGISGIVNWQQESDDRMLTRKLMTAEVNAAVEGAYLAGAQEVIVNDSHGSMRNVLIEDLDPRVQLISGDLKDYSMVQGVSEGVDAAMFVGYHSKAGTCRAILDHTYSGSSVHEIRINGTPVGESTINAAVCGAFDVPVVLITGDDSLAEEVKGIGARHAIVKYGYSRYSARHIHPKKARELILEQAKAALLDLDKFKPFRFSQPTTIEIEFVQSAMVEMALLVPEVKRIGARTVAFTHNDFITVFRAMLALEVLAGAVRKG